MRRRQTVMYDLTNIPEFTTNKALARNYIFLSFLMVFQGCKVNFDLTPGN